MGTGINDSKSHVTIVAGVPTGIGASKTHITVVCLDANRQGSSVGSGSIYLTGSGTVAGRIVHSYQGSGEIKLTGAGTSRGRHVGIATGSGSLYLAGVGQSYNVIGVPPPFSGSSQSVNIYSPMDIIDIGLQATSATGGPGMQVADFYRSMFILDTNDYDGQTTYIHQIIAKNTNASDQVVSLMRVVAMTIDPGSITSQVVSTITVPAATSEWTLFQTNWTPTSGENKYYWNVPYTGGAISDVVVRTGRAGPNQIGATKTLLWRPVADGSTDSHFGIYIDSSPPKAQDPKLPGDWKEINGFYGIGGTWYWNPSLYVGGSVSIVLEANCGGTYGPTTTEVRLYDVTANQAVPGSNFFVPAGGLFDWPDSNVVRKELNPALLTAGHLYKMEFRISSISGGLVSLILANSRFNRGMFGIKIGGIKQCEVAYRVAKTDGAPVGSDDGSSRVRLDAVGGNSRLLYLKNETCSQADFDLGATPELDFWIADDDHRTSGDGTNAVIVTSSNAHQDPVADLLPIFSADFKDYYTASNMFTMRGIPVPTDGDANSAWTLILLAVESSYFQDNVCSVERQTRELACIERDYTDITCLTATPSEVACIIKTEEEAACLSRQETDCSGFTRVS